MISSDKLLRNIMDYANRARCACSACRALREYHVAQLKDRINKLQENLKDASQH